MARWKLDRKLILDRLETVEPGEDHAGEDAAWLRTMRLAPNLLQLARIDQEEEHALCRAVAEHLGQHPSRL
jgi:hypothetical protein